MKSGDRLTPQAFAERWRRSKLTERAAAQSHFVDLCRMLGQPTPTEADPEGDFYRFERRVSKSGSGAGKGFADVWYRHRFAFEYKGKHKDLGAAYDQLLLYREDLENLPLLVVSDMERFEVHTNFERTKKRVYAFTNDDIGEEEPEAMRVLRALFADPDALKPGQTSEGVTEEAARKFAHLADGLRGPGVDPQKAARDAAENEREESEYDPAASGTYEDYADEERGSRGGVMDSIVLVVVDGEDERDALTGGIGFEAV